MHGAAALVLLIPKTHSGQPLSRLGSGSANLLGVAAWVNDPMPWRAPLAPVLPRPPFHPAWWGFLHEEF